MKTLIYLALAIGLPGLVPAGRLAADPPPEEPVYGVAPVQDDYLYYPAFEVYYSNVHHEYIYREGGHWVTRATPPSGVSLERLRSSPYVHLKFHDHPSTHHAAVIHDYPRDWTPQALTPPAGRDKEDRRNDLRDERHDALPVQPGPPR